MIKSARALALVALAMMAFPAAQAHGAAPPREVDVRVLLDDDGLLGYGGCGISGAGGTPCAPEPEGLDVLALDVREAWLGDQPAIAWRMIVQSASAHDGRGLLLTLTANGTERHYAVASPDGISYTSSDFDVLAGPFDVFDGHPKAVDGWLRLSSLGVGVGDDIGGITLASTHHEALDDVMPGGYYSNGVEVPHIPHGPDPGEATSNQSPGSYSVKGPAALLTLDGVPTLLDLNRSGNVTFKLGNALASTTQTVVLTVMGDTLANFGNGETATTLTLDPASTRQVTLSWPTNAFRGNATIVATSDLGGRIVAEVQVIPATSSHTVSSTSPSAQDTPAPAVVPLALALAALAARRR